MKYGHCEGNVNFTLAKLEDFKRGRFYESEHFYEHYIKN